VRAIERIKVRKGDGEKLAPDYRRSIGEEEVSISGEEGSQGAGK